MIKNNTGRVSIVILTLMSLALIISLAATVYRNTRIQNVLVAAGAPKTESYVIMEALKAVVELHYPRIKLLLHKTAGTTESLSQLESGEAQLAPAQADGKPKESASMVAVLYEDNFQLLVNKNSNIQKLSDLEGKKIAIPSGGGQFDSFAFLAKRAGIKKFEPVGASEDAAGVKFSSGEADALFRVRGVPNAFIRELALTGKYDFVPISQVAALHVDQPAYTATVIPQGAYTGDPPMPATDLPTIGLERLLLARRDVDGPIIAAISEVLMDRRQELSDAIPQDEAPVRTLLAGIKRPEQGKGVLPGIHPGALAFYNREQSTFVARNLDLIALAIATMALGWLWSIALNRSAEAVQKARAGEYHSTIVQLIEEARSSDSDRQLEPIRAELLMMMTAAIRDLGNGKMSEESFQSFRVIWQVAVDISHNRAESPALLPGSPQAAVRI